MLEQAGVDTWARIRSVLAAAAGGGNQPAFSAAIAGVPDIFFSRWGPGLVRDPNLGPEREYTGPFIPRSTVRTSTITNGGRPVISTIQARGSVAGKLEIRADVITIQADRDLKGLMRSGGDQLRLKKGAYCAKRGGCKCRTQANLALPQLAATTYFGYSDKAKARTVTFTGRSLRDYCKRPSPGPAGGAGASDGPASCDAPGGAQARAPCPESPGINVFYYGPQPAATFKTADCTAGDTFVAIANDGAFRLEIGITAFSGFGQYDIPFLGADPTFFLDAPDGEFGNTYPGPTINGVTLGGSGGLKFEENGRVLNFGYGPIWGSPGPTGYGGFTIGGSATCIYPDDG
jgi:hypothetical protein